MHPISALAVTAACKWTNGFGNTRQVWLKASWVWTLQAPERSRRKFGNSLFLSMWKWKQFEKDTNKGSEVWEKVFKKGKLLISVIFSRAHHTATGLTQWTISFLIFYLFKLYLCECFELVSDASYNTETPPSLIQLYCSLLFLAMRSSFGFYLSTKGPVWKYARHVGKEKETRMYCKILFSFT